MGKFATNASGASWWPNFATYARSGAIWWANLQLMEVAPSDSQICNLCKWCYVVAKFDPSHGVNFWVRCASGNALQCFSKRTKSESDFIYKFQWRPKQVVKCLGGKSSSSKWRHTYTGITHCTPPTHQTLPPNSPHQRFPPTKIYHKNPPHLSSPLYSCMSGWLIILTRPSKLCGFFI